MRDNRVSKDMFKYGSHLQNYKNSESSHNGEKIIFLSIVWWLSDEAGLIYRDAN